MLPPKLRLMFSLAMLFVVTTLLASCKPVAAPLTAYAAPDGQFTLGLPPGFEIIAGDRSVAAKAAGLGISYTGFLNAKTRERIAVAFIPVIRNSAKEVQTLRFGMLNIPLGDEWQGTAFYAMALAAIDTPDMDYWVTKTMATDTARIDLRKKESNAALSLFYDVRGQTLAVLAVTNPNEPAHDALGTLLLDRLLPTFVWPASAGAP